MRSRLFYIRGKNEMKGEVREREMVRELDCVWSGFGGVQVEFFGNFKF
jgi:hypothetical protein